MLTHLTHLNYPYNLSNLLTFDKYDQIVNVYSKIGL